MKILFYSPYSGDWYLHTYWEATIAHALRHRGAEVRFVGCDSFFPACDIFWGNSTRTEQGCQSCHALGRRVFENLHLEHAWLSDRVNPEDRREVSAWLAGMADVDLFTAQFDGRPLGEWCKSSLIAHYRQPDFGELSGEQAQTFRNYLFGGALAMRSLSRQLDEFQPDCVAMLNGSFFSHRVANELARERGLRVIHHERGLLPESLTFAENQAIWARPRLDECRDRWQAVPLLEAELEDAYRLIMQRRYGKELSWHAFSPPPQPIEATRARLGIPSGRKIVTLFTSSQSEASTADWRGPYPEMIEWVADTIRWFDEHPDYHLIVRIHPNEDHMQGRSGRVMERYERTLAQLPANVSVVWPKDDVSSYTLIDMSTATLVYNSTVGLETAVSRGIPVGVVGRPMYQGWGFTLDLDSKESYPAFLENLLSTAPSDEYRRRALRAAFRLFFGLSIPFPLVKVVNFSHGELRYQSVEELAPGRHASLDRIAEGILGRSPLYLPPTEFERQRTTDAEDAFLAAHPSLLPIERPLPSVSIVAYVYNYAHYLDEAIQAILKQTHTAFELYILDDGSTDGTREVVAKYLHDPRVRYEYQANKGRARLHETFNRCLEATTGDLIAIANGDDLMHPEKIARQVTAFLADPSLEVIYHDASYIDAEGRDLGGSIIRPIANDVFERRLFGRQMFRCCLVPNPTAMFRRSILRRIGLQEYGWPHDFQFWLKAAVARCRFAVLPDKLLKYRAHEESHSTSSKRHDRLGEEARRMRREMRERYAIDELYPEIAFCADEVSARASAHLDLGNLMLRAELPDPGLAVPEFEAALELAPDFPEAHNNLGVSLLMSGDCQAGQEVLQKALERFGLAAIASNLEVARIAPKPEQANYTVLGQDPRQIELFQVSWPSEANVPAETTAATFIAATGDELDPLALGRAMASYLTTFQPEDPYPLVVLSTSDPQTQQIALAYEEAVASLGLDPALTPSVDIQQVRPAEFNSVFLAQLLSAHAFLPLGDQAGTRTLMSLAEERGRTVLPDADADALRRAATTRPELPPAWSGESLPLRHPSVEEADWEAPALDVATAARDRWLVADPEAWEANLAAVLADYASNLDLCLMIRVPEGAAETRQEQILAWLTEHGYDPDAIPDVLLIDAPSSARVSVFRAATAVLDTGCPRERNLAQALGLRYFQITKGTIPHEAPPPGEPRVSVIIPCYNYGRFLRTAVESVLAQTHPACEVIIVDDGSTDDSRDVAQALMADYPTFPIRLHTQQNGGHLRARNSGIEQASGHYIVTLDADDKLPPNYLAACVAALEAHPEASVAYPNVQKFGNTAAFDVPPAYSFELLQRFNYLTMATLFKRQAWEDVGGFPTHEGYEDWDFWIRCGKQGHRGVHVPAATNFYRIHGASVYGQDRAKDQRIKARVVLNHPDLYTAAQSRWAQGVMDKEAWALAIDSGLGMVPQLTTLPPTVAVTARPLEAFSTVAASAPAPKVIPADHPLHILFTMYGWAEEGGGTILPRQIAKALVRRGHRITVIYTPSQNRPDKPAYHVEASEEEGVQLFAIYNRPAIFYDMEHPEREADDPQMRRIIAQLVAELRPDIVHYHSLLNFSTGIAAEIKQAGVPSVFTSHNYWPICPRMYLFQEDLTLCSGPSEDGSKCAICVGRPDQTGGYALRADSGRQMLNRWVDRHLAVSHRVKELYAGSGHDASRIHVLQQQPETVEWLWEKAGSRRPLEGALDRPLKVGFIGSLLPQKGVHVLVRALQSFGRDQIEGHLFGSGPKAYEDMLHEIDAKGLVKFHGRYDVEQLPELLKRVDVVVIPSIWEDCAPLVVAEALAARCPVIGSRIGGIPDFIEEGKTGYLVDPRNAPGLGSALFQFVRDPGLLGRMQRAIQAPRGFDAYLDELVGHYHDVRARQGLRLVWEGSQFVRHSLALINREVCRRLAESGLELSIVPYEADEFGPEVDPSLQVIADRTNAPLTGPADVHVRHQWPPKFEPPAEGAWAMIQPWEFGGIPHEWVEPMTHQVDEIWVPTSHVRDGYLRSGIPADKVIVIPNGVDTDRLHPDAPKYPLATRKRFKFLFVGGTILRKGIDVLLEAYVKAFTAADDVCLVIKDLGGKSFYKGQTAKDRIAEIQANPLAPEIEYLDDPLSDAEIAGLYAACHCLVHPYRGEGFALPIAEAMATSLPVIVTGYGACLDFCDSETAFLIPAREVPLPPSSLPPSAVGYWWAEPDGDALITLMQSVVADPAHAKAVGKRARDRILSGFTWAHMAERILERLRILGMRTPTRFALSDPFQAGLMPLPLEDRRRYAFLHHPQWGSTSWQEVVTSYARAFPADADVSLVLWLDPSQGVTPEDAGERIAGALAEAGLDPEDGPDLLLVPDALDLPGLARLYTAVDCIVTHGEERDAQRAGKVGKRTLDDLSVDGWQGAAALGQSVHV